MPGPARSARAPRGRSPGWRSPRPRTRSARRSPGTARWPRSRRRRVPWRRGGNSSEEPGADVVDPAKRLVVEDHAADPAVLRQDPRLRLDLLSGEDARHRRQVRISVHQLEVAGELLDAVDLA